MASRLVFTGKQQVKYESFEPPKVDKGMIKVRALYSLISTGTETIVYNRLFDAGSHWDNWVKYPFYPGYSMVGEVVETGPECKAKVGDRLAMRTGHASVQVIPEAYTLPVPREMDPKSASWFALAKITFTGARAAQYSLGDSVLIIGAGPIGQMSTRWARAAGVETIIVCDMLESRLKLAKAGGATHILPKPINQCAADIKSITKDQMTRVVLDGTGNAEVFSQALQLARHRGRVVVLGDTGAPTLQHLTPDLILRGLTVIGAHDGHTDAEWSEQRMVTLFFNLCLTNRFDMNNMITHTFQPQDCVKAFETASNRKAEAMGLLFDWTGIKD